MFGECFLSESGELSFSDVLFVLETKLVPEFLQLFFLTYHEIIMNYFKGDWESTEKGII